MFAGPRPFPRRNLLHLGVAAIGASAARPIATTRAGELLRRTPDQILGPFWPVDGHPDHSGDLTRIPGASAQAQGDILHVMGRVVNRNGDPVAGARMEIWQANAFGRYTHPSDRNPAPLDPNFRGFAEIIADSEGRYHFKTVKPGGYPVAPGVSRPPHIHFDISGHYDRLVTQMYFDGEPDNDRDMPLHSTRHPDLLIVTLRRPPPEFEANSRVANFDIVLLQG